jgi:hypothetical protein
MAKKSGFTWRPFSYADQSPCKLGHLRKRGTGDGCGLEGGEHVLRWRPKVVDKHAPDLQARQWCVGLSGSQFEMEAKWVCSKMSGRFGNCSSGQRQVATLHPNLSWLPSSLAAQCAAVPKQAHLCGRRHRALVQQRAAEGAHILRRQQVVLR